MLSCAAQDLEPACPAPGGPASALIAASCSYRAPGSRISQCCLLPPKCALKCVFSARLSVWLASNLACLPACCLWPCCAVQGQGLSEKQMRLCDGFVYIPQHGQVRVWLQAHLVQRLGEPCMTLPVILQTATCNSNSGTL